MKKSLKTLLKNKYTNYRISKEDLEILAKDVKELLRLTKESCEKEINLNS